MLDIVSKVRAVVEKTEILIGVEQREVVRKE
jgi:hypothetical protein